MTFSRPAVHTSLPRVRPSLSWLAFLLFVFAGAARAQALTPVLVVTPATVQLRSVVTADSSNLDPDQMYTLDWGDTETDTLNGARSAQTIHNYRQPGTYTVRLSAPNGTPAVGTVTVTFPVPTATTTADQLDVTLNLGNLLVDYPYEINWGDKATETTYPNDRAVSLAHAYSQPGTYVITVTPQGASPVVTTVTLLYPAPILVLTPGQVQAGQPVTADVSRLQPTSTYTLTWGDGSTEPLTGSATAQKIHTYAQPGTYTVTVTSAGTAPTTGVVSVTVPTPVLSATPKALTATLNLSNLLSGYSYTVSYGDGVTEPLTPTATTATLTHTYAAPGNYVLLITPQGAPPATSSVTVNAPNSVMTATPSSAAVRQTVTANLATLAPGLTYTLDWGDTTSETITGVSSAQKTHAYAAPGTYTVTLTSPGTAPVTVLVSVAVPAPVLSATVSGLTASLNVGALVSGYLYTVAWGDASTAPLTPTSDTTTLTHTYQVPGTYAVQVTPQAAAPVVTTVQTDVPNPVLSVTPAQASVRQTVTASLTALVPALSYKLDYGDGTSDTVTGETAVQKTHLYYQPGTYTVTLTSPGTPPATATVTVSVPVPALSATASALSVTLDLSRLLSEYTYQVVWADGVTESLTATSDTAVLTHTYAAPGTYTLQVSTQGGAPATTSVTVSAPNSVLTVTPGTATVQQTVTANLSALTRTLNYILDWKDGTTEAITGVASVQKTHAYASPGTYTVTVSSPGTAPATASVTVNVPAPVVTVAVTDLTTTLNLSNLLSGYAYTVSYGDGVTEPLTPTAGTATLTHTYTAPGTFQVQVTPQASAPVTTTVTATAPEIGLSVAPSTARILQPITATITGLIPSSGAKLSWGDDTLEPLVGTGTVQRTHSYTVAGNYLVQVNANIVPVRITVQAPTVTATAANLTVTLRAGNLIPGYSYIVNWEYNVAETFMATADTANLTHTYALPGTVAPSVTPQGGLLVGTTVTLSASSAVLTLTPSTVLPGETVTLNASNLLPKTYSIDWGDKTYVILDRGVTATRTHTYPSTGIFTVTLSAPDVAPVTATVTVKAPTPVMNVTPGNTSVRQTVSAKISNLREELSYVLDWQDGTTETISGVGSTQRDHAYNIAGTFNVTLTSAGTPPVSAVITTSIPAPAVTLSENYLTVTLNLGTLLSGNAYQIDWGDTKTQTLIPTASTATLTHTYTQPGSYAVTVSTAGVAPVTVTTTVRASAPILDVTPAEVNSTVPAQVGQTVTAILTNLVPALTYQLTWDDGTTDTITGVTTATRTHVYLKAGIFGISATQADGYTTRGFQVNVTLPAPVFTATAEQLDATATLTELIPVVTYSFDWGDGTPPVTVTGVTTALLTHHFRVPGDYSLLLKASDRVQVRQTLNVQVNPATITVTGAGLQATATVAGLQPELSYTLNWGDNTTETITGVTTATRSHTYLLPNTYTVSVAAPRVPAASANVITVASAPVLKVSATNLTATAEVSGLLPGVTYLLEWGDGGGQTLKDQLDVTLTHIYPQPGTYTVKIDQPPYLTKIPNIPGGSASVTVGLPPREVIQVTGHDELGGTTHFQISGLLPEGAYLLDFGDGTTPERLTGSATSSVDHTYQRSDTYTVALQFQTYTGNIVRATAVNTVQIPLNLQNAILKFNQSNSNADLTLTSADPIAATVTVSYRGGGLLTGRWLLDGQPVENVSLTLPEASGVSTVEVKFTRTETKPGRHTLGFEVTAPKAFTAFPLKYTLNAPDTLNYNGFKVAIRSVTRLSSNPGSSVTVSGTGTARLIVGGTQLSDVNVTFEGQVASENGMIREGTVTVDLNGAAVRSARLGDLQVQLSRLRLNKDGAALSGSVTLPGLSSPMPFTDTALAPDTGDLTATLTPNIKNLKLPEDGLSFSAAAAVLDLSSTQNPSELAGSYKDQTTPQNDWMGVVFPAASLTVGSPVLSQPVSLTVPLVYNLSGYVTTLDLPSGSTTLNGWKVNLTTLHASVLAGRISTTTGTGTVTLPLVEEPMDLTLGWDTNARPGSRFTFNAFKNVSVKNHVFGKTSLTLGEGVWNKTPAGLVVTFANARWFLDNQGNDLAMSNLTMNATGDVTLGGQAWTSITGNTALTVLGYPYAGVEVGVQRQGGDYTLGLKGKLQINEKLPSASSNTQTLFWVQSGKDVKVTTEAQHLTGELAKVPYDINLTGAFNDQGRLEFTGTGKMTVAKLLNVDAKATFGRSGSVGYGSVTASLSANPDLGKPLVSAKRVEVYEIQGGLTVNMNWPNGLDQPPVFRENGTNTVGQFGALLSVKQDPGTPVKPFLNGLLSVDTSGQFDMKADLWLVKDGQKLNRKAPNGRALVSVSADRLLVQACVGPNGGGAPGGLNCAGVAELNLYDLMTLKGSLELYAPFSGSDQHLYIGTRANPVVVRVPNYPEGQGYLMIDQSQVRAGAGVAWSFEKGNSGSLLVCSWNWNIKAQASLNGDFGIVYSPPALDGHVNFSASASASAGGCGINVGASAAMQFDGDLHLAKAGNYFDGTVSASVGLPVIPNINFSVNTRVNF